LTASYAAIIVEKNILERNTGTFVVCIRPVLTGK
jgi:hypothetical protein